MVAIGMEKNGNRFKTGRGTDIFGEELGMLLTVDVDNLLIFSFTQQVFIRYLPITRCVLDDMEC